MPRGSKQERRPAEIDHAHAEIIGAQEFLRSPQARPL